MCSRWPALGEPGRSRQVADRAHPFGRHARLLRAAELAGLCDGDIAWPVKSNGTVRLAIERTVIDSGEGLVYGTTKTKRSERRVPLTAATADILRDCRRNSDEMATSLKRWSRSSAKRNALNCGYVEPMTGIEPAFSAWEADVLPLNYIGAFAPKG